MEIITHSKLKLKRARRVKGDIHINGATLRDVIRINRNININMERKGRDSMISRTGQTSV